MKDQRRTFKLDDFKAFYSHWSEILKDEQERIKASSEARKVLIKDIETADPWELLETACGCIYDLTGDTIFRDVTKKKIKQRKNKGD